jgi:hypothetical protein
MNELDIPALKAQVEDGVPWRDGVLTYQQAMTLIKEIERLRTRERTLSGERAFLLSRIASLMAVMS